MIEIKSNLNNLSSVVRCLRNISADNKIIFLLRGDLASGKTTLVRAYCACIYPNEYVTSPTFSFLHQYQDIYHYDFYQYSLNDCLNLGFLECLEEGKIHFIEWGDKSLEVLLKENGYDVCVIELLKEEDKRIYRIFHG